MTNRELAATILMLGAESKDLKGKEAKELLKQVEEEITKHIKDHFKNGVLHSVSKRFEIDFEGAVLADIEITNNEPKIHRGVNGYGIGVNPDKCKIKRVK